jgi:O-antigen ligase
LVYFITQIGLLPYVFDLDYFDEESAITFNEGYVRMRFMGLNSLPYLIPYIMTEIISPSIEPNKQLRSRLWLWLALILGLSLVILSGRRVTLLITLLSPLIVYLFSLYSPNQLHKRINRNIIVLSIAAIVLIYVLLFYLDIHFGVNLSTLYNMLSEGFNFGTAVGTAESEGAFVRREQFYALINGWLDNPFFGAGLGTFAPGYIRNPEMPWAYELSYVALLYQVGLVGILIYAGGILWIFYMGVKIMKQEEYLGSMMLPLLVGMTCYLIANITNPYLVRFDGIWVIFLPIALINRWLLSEHKDEPAKYSPIK